MRDDHDEPKPAMLGLTLKHPWPFAITRLGKRIENRTWKPPANLIGKRFAIHAGVVPGGEGLRNAVEELQDLIARFGPGDITAGETMGSAMTPGIVATAVLSDVVTASDDPWFEGPVGWCLDDLIVMPRPIPCRGAQRLWTVPDDVLARIYAAQDAMWTRNRGDARV